MKVKCNGRTELRGHIYARGEIAEVSEAELAERPGCFTPIDEKAEADAKSAETPDTKATNGLTKAQLMAKLDELGIAYKARDTAEELRKRLDEVIDHGATKIE